MAPCSMAFSCGWQSSAGREGLNRRSTLQHEKCSQPLRCVPAARASSVHPCATRHTVSTLTLVAEVELANTVAYPDKKVEAEQQLAAVEQLEVAFLQEGPLSMDEEVTVPEPLPVQPIIEPRPLVEWWNICTAEHIGRFEDLESAKASYDSLQDKQQYRLVYLTNQTYEEAVTRLQQLDLGSLPQPAGLVANFGTQAYMLEHDDQSAQSTSYKQVGIGKWSGDPNARNKVVMHKVQQALAGFEGWEVLEQSNPAVVVLYGSNSNVTAVHKALCNMQFSTTLEVGVSLTMLEKHSYIDLKIEPTYWEDGVSCLQRVWQSAAFQRSKLQQASPQAHAPASANAATAPTDAAAHHTTYSRPFLLQAAFACAASVLAVEKAARLVSQELRKAQQVIQEQQAKRQSIDYSLPLHMAAAYFVAVHSLTKVMGDTTTLP